MVPRDWTEAEQEALRLHAEAERMATMFRLLRLLVQGL